jgi:hypothetical protein
MVVLNKRCPVSVPPFPLYSFSDTLNATTPNPPSSRKTSISALPLSSVPACTTPATSTTRTAGCTARSSATNSSTDAPEFTTESTTTTQRILRICSAGISAKRHACANDASGNARLTPKAMGSPPRISGTISVPASNRTRWPSVGVPCTCAMSYCSSPSSGARCVMARWCPMALWAARRAGPARAALRVGVAR